MHWASKKPANSFKNAFTCAAISPDAEEQWFPEHKYKTQHILQPTTSAILLAQ